MGRPKKDAKEIPNKTLAERDQLIEEYRGYVHSVVKRLIRYVGLSAKHHEEYVSAGYLGLVEAAERYDLNSTRTFKQYAFLRIRGAIIDNIRKSANHTAHAYRKLKALGAFQNLQESNLEDRLANSSSANHTRDTDQERSRSERLAGLYQLIAKGAVAYRLSLSDVGKEISDLPSTAKNPEEKILSREKTKEFMKMLTTLSEKERLIVEQYYFKEKSFIEIADEFEGMSKSWVSRLHTRALEKIKVVYLEDNPSL